MEPYPKINTIWKRTDRGPIIPGEYATPELRLLRAVEWEWTEKVDGTNIRVGWDGHAIAFGGRTENSQMPAKLVQVLAQLFSPQRFESVFAGTPVTLYGEGYGAKIQKGGGNYRPDQSFVLIDVRIDNRWLRRDDVRDVANKLGIDTVPVIQRGGLYAACVAVRAGITSTWGPFPAEGLVGRPVVELFSRKGERIMAKIKTRDYVQLANAEGR